MSQNFLSLTLGNLWDLSSLNESTPITHQHKKLTPCSIFQWCNNYSWKISSNPCSAVLANNIYMEPSPICKINFHPFPIHNIQFSKPLETNNTFSLVRFLQCVHHVYTISTKLQNHHCIMEIRTNFYACFPQIHHSSLKTDCFLFS
jgi:hypothetical protein